MSKSWFSILPNSKGMAVLFLEQKSQACFDFDRRLSIKDFSCLALSDPKELPPGLFALRVFQPTVAWVHLFVTVITFGLRIFSNAAGLPVDLCHVVENKQPEISQPLFVLLSNNAGWPRQSER